MIRKFRTKWQKHWDDVLAIKTSPHSIAMGFALGTFLAIMPTFGFGIVIGLMLILLFKDISKLSMFFAFAIWNPFVLAILYPIQYAIGNTILPAMYRTEFSVEVVNQIFFYTGRLFIGSILMSVLAALICYGLVYGIVLNFSEHHKQENAQKKANRKMSK